MEHLVARSPHSHAEGVTMPLAEDDRLLKLPILAALTPEMRARVAQSLRWRHYAKGERIFSEGDRADRVFGMISGRVRVFHSSAEGAELLITTFQSPALFGEAEALRGGTYVGNADAIVAAEIAEIPVASLLEVLRTDPSAAMA